MFIIQEFQNIMIIWYVQQFKSFKHFAICKIMMNYAMLFPVEFCIKQLFVFIIKTKSVLCLPLVLSAPSRFPCSVLFALSWNIQVQISHKFSRAINYSASQKVFFV